MSESAPRVSTPHLFVEAVAQLAGLFRTELRLVRTELGEKAAKAMNAIVVMSGAGILLLVALIILLEGAVAFLVTLGLKPHWAALAVGLPVAVLAVALLLSALGSLKLANLRPERALDQVSKDMNVAKEIVR
jgi:hypothetical protein